MATRPPSDDLMKILRVRVGLLPDDSSKDPQIISAYLNALSWIELYLDRYLEPGEYTETFTHVSNNVISLKGYPVVAIIDIEPDEGSTPSFHVEAQNGLIHFDGRAYAHQLTVTYDALPVINGALQIALFALFDLVWASQNVTVGDGSTGNGTIKSIVSDGARVEFDVSGKSQGSLDASSGLPLSVTAILHMMRRGYC